VVASALEALVGGEPAGEAVESALATIPAGELNAALRWLVREHGAAALPILRHCLADRPDRAIAAAHALGTLPLPEAAQALEAAEGRAATKPVRTAARRALYRLRQAGVDRPVAVSSPTPRRIALGDAWASAIDGTGGRGLWLTLAGPYGESTLLAAVLSDEIGLLDFSTGAMPKKRIDEQLRAVQAESPLPWVSVPASWAWATLVAAAERTRAGDRPVPPDLRAWIERLGIPAAEPAPVYARLPAEPAGEPALLERSGALLALPELAGWFLDPGGVASEALEWLQTKESRLVVSEQIKAERLTALIDRILERHFDEPTRRRWQGRLEDEAYVLWALGRTEEARDLVAVARALGDPAAALGRIPFLRALVERSLEIAGEVATGRLSAAAATRAPRPRAAEASGG
jgi:hypothetical protein